MEAFRDFPVNGIYAKCEVGGKHHRVSTFAGIMGVRNSSVSRAVFWPPLLCTGGAFEQLPVVLKEVIEVIIRPFGRRC